MENSDESWMRRALDLARQSGEAGEVPVGAVLVREGRVVAASGNRPIALDDPTAHAEILVLRAAGGVLGNYRLPGTTLYVTLEPCTMCVGAMIHARVERVVFGAADPKSGALGGGADVTSLPIHNHRLRVDGGILAGDCAELLKSFFRARR